MEFEFGCLVAALTQALLEPVLVAELEVTWIHFEVLETGGFGDRWSLPP